MTQPTVRVRRVRLALAAASALAVSCGAFGWPGPLSAQEGAAAVQDVTLADVALPLGGTLLKAPKLTASGTRLSRDALAAILKADSTEPWAARLARLDAGSLTIPVLTSEHAGPGDARQTVIYRDVVARDVRAGRIGQLSAAGATLSVAGGGKPGSGTYGMIRATDLDLAALNRLYAEPGDGHGPVLRVYGTLQVADVTYADAAGTTVTIARLDGGELGGRQVPGGWTGAFDALAGVLDGTQDRRREAAAAADLIEASALGSLEMRGLNVSDADPKGPLRIAIGRLAYAGAGANAGTSLEALSVARGSVRVRLARLALAGVSLAPTIATLRGLAATPDPGTGIGEDAARHLVPMLGSLTLSDLSVDLPPEAVEGRTGAPRASTAAARAHTPEGGRAGEGKTGESRPREPKPNEPKSTPIDPAQAKPGEPLAVAVSPAPAPRVALREATLGFGPTRDGVPTSSRLALAGLSLPADLVAGAPILGALPAYGYRDLDLDLTADAAWDEAAREFALREITLSGRDIGTVRISGLLGGIGPELLSGSVPASTMLMFSGSAKALDVSVENAGLFERFLAVQSKDLSLKPDELRKEYVTASLLGVPVILGNTAAAKGIGAAMGQFVMKPGKIVLRAKAKDAAGIGFIDLGAARSPAAVLDLLDVEAKAN